MVDKLTEYIIRPSKRTYNPDKDLGPSLFTIDHKYYGSRIDFEVKNRRKKTLKCSLFHHNIYNNESYPLMIYCHGNSGNRSYSYEIVYRMLKARVSVLAFDFSGCGNSDGKYISLGFFEQYDIDDVLEFALKNFNFIDPARVGVWGRSMGAVSALLFASRHENVSVIVLDSPFKDFSELLKEYINRFKILSALFGKYIYKKLRRNVLQKSGFDFENLKPIGEVSKCKAPAFFFTATKDKVVPKHHSKDLYNAYPGEKEFLEAKGGHNTKRGDEVYDKMVDFVKNVFARKVTNEELWTSLGISLCSYGSASKPRVKISAVRTPKPQHDTYRSIATDEDKNDPENIVIPESIGQVMYTQHSVADLEKKDIPELADKFVSMDNELDDQDLMKTCRTLKIATNKNSFSHSGNGDNTTDLTS